MSNQDTSLAMLKTPPYSLEAEQFLIGGILLEEYAYDYVAGVLFPKHFYRKEHQVIYEHIVKLRSENKNVDAVTVGESLKQNNQLGFVGGVDYLHNLVDSTTSSTNISSYAEIIRERFILRELISASNTIADSAYAPQGRNVDQLLDESEQKIFNIKDLNASNKQFAQFKDLLDEVITKMMEAAQREDKDGITGVATHYTELDNYTSGLQRGELIIVAGRPGMGKTSFALNIAENIALKNKMPVAVFSLEMPGVQLVQRMLSSCARVDQSLMKRGDVTHDEMDKIFIAMNELKSAPIHIAETSGINVIDLRARARRLVDRVGKLGVIVIDYVQIMSGINSGPGSNRAQEIAEISRSLKTLAIELDVPIILLSQLNRDVESRTDKRPNISDLRESGALEQDADIILLLYRDDYYNREDSKEKGIAEINIAKNRSGSTGTIKLAFLNQYTRFENLAYQWENEY
ncbi:MAG: replicative DNA helicase [Neisseriales bacterium]|nr:MAG: replicative DNA helicase [Neisseriales bacterium]HRG61829.1 replicative DNA helicase [Burkholderiales bacterium]